MSAFLGVVWPSQLESQVNPLVSICTILSFSFKIPRDPGDIIPYCLWILSAQGLFNEVTSVFLGLKQCKTFRYLLNGEILENDRQRKQNKITQTILIEQLSKLEKFKQQNQ